MAWFSSNMPERKTRGTGDFLSTLVGTVGATAGSIIAPVNPLVGGLVAGGSRLVGDVLAGDASADSLGSALITGTTVGVGGSIAKHYADLEKKRKALAYAAGIARPESQAAVFSAYANPPGAVGSEKLTGAWGY